MPRGDDPQMLRQRHAPLTPLLGKSSGRDVDKLAALRAAAHESLPDAADYAGTGAPWAGLRPVTPDSLPIVARRGAITVNVGHGGLGWTYALATAEQAAMLVVQER